MYNPSETLSGKYVADCKCHGCDGRGWVDSFYKGAVVCPICKGTGVIEKSPRYFYVIEDNSAEDVYV